MVDVPNVPGVPGLSSYGLSDAVLLVGDLVTAFLGLPPIWGVFDQFGLPAFAFANSTVSFEYKQDWAIANYPVEQGSFQTYDKVQLPFDVRVRIASGPDTIDRQLLLNSIQVAANSFDLFNVVTPEKIFTSCSITHYDYHRTAVNGVSMLAIDIWFQQIRETSTTLLSNVISPVVSGQQSLGTVQPVKTDIVPSPIG